MSQISIVCSVYWSSWDTTCPAVSVLFRAECKAMNARGREWKKGRHITISQLTNSSFHRSRVAAFLSRHPWFYSYFKICLKTRAAGLSPLCSRADVNVCFAWVCVCVCLSACVCPWVNVTGREMKCEMKSAGLSWTWARNKMQRLPASLPWRPLRCLSTSGSRRVRISSQLDKLN